MMNYSSVATPPIFVALMFLVISIYDEILAAAFTTPHHLHSRIPIQIDSFANNIYTANDRIRQISATHLHLFGNLFGNEVVEDQIDLAEGELARFSYSLPSNDNPQVKFDSLSIMMSEWAKLFTDEEQDMGLTTPVEVKSLSPQHSPSDDPDVSAYAGTQLLFVKRKTGGYSAYKDKDDEKNKDEKKDKEVKEGGVEVRVEQLTNGDLQVVATRCEIEEGTLVKEMSEGIIIDSLRKAVAAWKKEQES
mmetsp:Transcript_17537/g.37915  ORF Transcript_17537/g.37915 Transcript_17537/m.37915 type:complete len:248 (+) Transcript_17537:372-1115(+)|eukprot:CAMPEP_0172552802 /NCGR_PEP_ID=MMETSP1067-20121228/47198_1 /TAXON_ID=265564 ORGANISM="Thalassiosira punctigera, Strain Tpunct2005C2" /NCGR_SAMPLE_ID=MMETSP1067 /ASSEMBLY_ACC=CAM_ASM_000444 /LENGTH=247 /DNA_ID=CAMNT_0013340859 /DNA_START=351 /DNA_END=1094 /DNA_ORIENTATION=-